MAKTRTDFVSNSSSCSFIISVGKDNVPNVLKDIAKACVNKKDEYHDPNLQKRNLKILDFCTSTYQLAFIGSLVIEHKVEEYTRKKFKEIFHEKELADREFDRMVADIKKAKGKKAEKWLKDYVGKDKYDEEKGVITHHEDVTQEGMVITNDDMHYTLSRYHFTGPDCRPAKDKKAERKDRAERLFKAAKEAIEAEKKILTYREPDIYEITQDTLDNTLDLLEFKYEFSKPAAEVKKLIKKYQQQIENGNRVFVLRQAYSGDGYGDYYIYCEDGADGIEKVSGIEFLGGGCL